MPPADRTPARSRQSRPAAGSAPFTEKEVTVRVYAGHMENVWRVAMPADGRFALTTGEDGTLRWWDLTESERAEVTLTLGAPIRTLSITPNGTRCVAGSITGKVYILESDPPNLLHSITVSSGSVEGIAILAHGSGFLSADADTFIQRWDIESDEIEEVGWSPLSGLDGVAASTDGQWIVGTSTNQGIVCWKGGISEPSFFGEESISPLSPLALSANGHIAVVGRSDGKLAVWDIPGGKRKFLLEGHSNTAYAAAVSPDGCFAVSGGADGTVRLWHLPTKRCLGVMKGSAYRIFGVALTPNARRIASVGSDGCLHIWDIPPHLLAVDDAAPRSGYRCAKVVLVGESGAGKSGLRLRLAENKWRETGSTHGMEIRKLTLPSAPVEKDVAQEVWLWDLAGQADFRLVHQLYMERTAVALLVFDPQRGDLFTTVPYWQEALRKACAGATPQYVLVAARGDVSPLPMSLPELEQWAARRGIHHVVLTAAAKDDHPGATALLERLSSLIPWAEMTPHFGQEVFVPLKETVIILRGNPAPGDVVMEMDRLHQRVAAEAHDVEFTREDLLSAVHILDTEGVVKRLDYGELVLLQPEALNNYASAVVSMARADRENVGHVPLASLCPGGLPVPADKKLSAEDEAQLLPALVQTFLERSLAWKQQTEDGFMLVLPSYAQLPPPPPPERPWQTVVYTFTGPLEEIYATLVVRLRCSRLFTETKLYREAAEFLTATEKLAALAMQRDGEKGALAVHFAKELHADVQAAFQWFVDEHLKERALNVQRVRNYFCPKCGAEAKDREVINELLLDGEKTMPCQRCYRKQHGIIDLMDVLEVQHAEKAGGAKAKEMGETADVVLSTQSKEQVMVGEVTALVAGANQILRSITVRDEGVDAEIEFTNDKGRGTNIIVQLQLKAGDSHLTERKTMCPAFRMEDHYTDYWTARPGVPVYLVVRTSTGKMEYIDATAAIHEARKKQPGKPVMQLDFEGRPFDKAAVLAMRDEALRQAGKK